MKNKELFERFAKDIIFDCHSLRAKVSRSDAGKQIIKVGPAVLSELAEHLNSYKPPTEIEALADEVRYGWGILLSWFCEEHSLDRKGLNQKDFNSWIEWLKDFIQVPA